MINRKFFQITLVLFLWGIFSLGAKAQNLPAAATDDNFSWLISNQPQWQSPDGNLQLNLNANQSAKVTPQSLPELPAPWQAMTSAYQLKVDGHLKDLRLKPDNKSSWGTAVLVLVADGQWQELKTKLNNDGSRVVNTPGSATLVLAANTQRQEGIASWYRYKNCLCAASRDFPKGTQLEVARADNPDRKITVKVNDYGPELQTGCLIDLDVKAFKVLENKRSGLLLVTVKPVADKK